MIRKITCIVVLLGAALSSFCQKPESVLFSIGSQNIMLSEFQYIYEKNNKNDKNFYSDTSVREYLNLFINFKLKVAEARANGIDTTEKFRNEFKTYRDQLTKPYLTDKKATDNLIAEAYDRMKEELRASHILIRLNEDAPKEEVDKALAKINEIYKRAKKGEDFGKLAIELSEDPSAKVNSGDLGYFSVFHLIYSFENVAYNTSVGKISKPFRTEFGYHILKVTDRRPYQGQIKVAQILLAYDENATDADKENIKASIFEIHKKLKGGESFDNMVKLYSDDERTKNNNGVLPEFNSFSFNVPDIIKENSFKIANIGDISEPIETNYGWVILKKLDIKGLKPFEEMENFIRSKVRKDSRSEMSNISLIQNLKKQFSFKEYPKNLQVFKNSVDTNILNGSWKPKEIANSTLPLFLIGKKVYSVGDFAKYTENKQKMVRFANAEFTVNKIYESYVNENLLAYADQHLEENYPEFKNLVNEYLEGMMLFEITDQKVWTKAMKDTLGQEEFYEKNIANYMWKKRVDAEIYICRSEEIANNVVASIKSNKTSDVIAEIENVKNPLNISYSKGKYEMGENKYLNNYFGQSGVFIFHETETNSWRVINLIRYYEPEPKKLKEIRGIVIADYQSFLDEEWLKELKNKYPVKINNKILEELINNYKKK